MKRNKQFQKSEHSGGAKRVPIRYEANDDKPTSRSRSPISRSRNSRSSSRGTFDGLDYPTPKPQFNCKICRHCFSTIRELSDHEIRSHDNEIGCASCEKKSSSVARLAAHVKFRHGTKIVICYYCDKSFGRSAEKMDEVAWDEFRDHIHKEAVKKRMYRHGTTQSNASVGMILRGVGSCPHGPPVKCKNFPQCPGAKCIYSHSMCRYQDTCNKLSCPFDHPNRHRTCMSCVNDMKIQKKRN